MDALTSSLSPAENVAAAAETSLVGREVNGPSVMDAAPVQIVSQADHKVETGGRGDATECVFLNGGGDLNEEERGEAIDEEGGDNVCFSNENEDEEEDLDDTDGDDDYDTDDLLNKTDSDMDEDDDSDDFMDRDDTDEDEYKVLDVDEDKEGGNIARESEKKENEEKGGVSLEPKVKNLKKVNTTKVAVRNNSDEVIVTEKAKSVRDGANSPMDKEKGDGTEEVGEKGEGSLKKKVSRLGQGDGKKKVINLSSVKAASEPKDKLNSNRWKKGGSRRAESMGMIFMCSSKTKKDCYRYKVLGLPAGKRDLVEKIYRGMRLFLYDVDLKLLYGIYKAAGRGGYNIEPKAFNSKFPSQVRFTVLEDCIPLAEEKFRKVIKENYFTKNKFDCQLNNAQVKNLCKLFIAASKGALSRRLDERRKAKVQAPIHRNRSRARGVDEERRTNRSSARGVDGGRRIALDENYRHQDDYFHVRQRDVVPPPVIRVSRLSPLPPPIDAPRYAYDRTLERDAYRPTVLVEHRDPYRRPVLAARDAYRQQPVSEYRDTYRQEPPLDHHDAYRRDRTLEHRDLRPINVEVRRPEHRDLQPINVEVRRPERRDLRPINVEVRRPEHRDLRPINVEVRRRDDFAIHEPYVYYREHESHHDPGYSEHRLPVERARYRSARTEYRSRGSPVADYRPTQALYRDLQWY